MGRRIPDEDARQIKRQLQHCSLIFAVMHKIVFTRADPAARLYA
jgi:hypothetical protein